MCGIAGKLTTRPTLEAPITLYNCEGFTSTPCKCAVHRLLVSNPFGLRRAEHNSAPKTPQYLPNVTFTSSAFRSLAQESLLPQKRFARAWRSTETAVSPASKKSAKYVCCVSGNKMVLGPVSENAVI